MLHRATAPRTPVLRSRATAPRREQHGLTWFFNNLQGSDDAGRITAGGQAARAAGLAVTLIDHDALVRGGSPERAVASVPEAHNALRAIGPRRLVYFGSWRTFTEDEEFRDAAAALLRSTG